MDTTVIRVGAVDVELIDADDRVVWHQQNDAGGFEPESLTAWAAAVRPGWLALDVGAYTGLYAIAAAKLGARAVAVEPLEANAARLRENVRRNQAPVRVVEAAASDRLGSEPMYAKSAATLPSGARLGLQQKGATHRQDVPLLRLDDYFHGIPCAAVKIDAERHEPRVLAGASRILARWRPVLIIEALGDSERVRIEQAIPGYRVERTIERNLLMVAR